MAKQTHNGAANSTVAAPSKHATRSRRTDSGETTRTHGGGNRGRSGYGPNAGSWPPGQSGNPKGAPRRGESWREVIREVGDKTIDEAIAHYPWIAARIPADVQVLGVSDQLTLKELIVVNVFAALIKEPDSALWNGLMNRAEGNPEQPVEFGWKSELAEWLRDGKVTIEEIRTHLSDTLFAEFAQYLGPTVQLLEPSADSGAGGSAIAHRRTR